jgi:hypothetical protein
MPASSRSRRSAAHGPRVEIRRAYPVESRLVLGIERLAERLRGRPRTERLALLIT